MCDCGGGVSGAQRGNSGGASPVLGSRCWAGTVVAPEEEGEKLNKNARFDKLTG